MKRQKVEGAEGTGAPRRSAAEAPPPAAERRRAAPNRAPHARRKAQAAPGDAEALAERTNARLRKDASARRQARRAHRDAPGRLRGARAPETRGEAGGRAAQGANDSNTASRGSTTIVLYSCGGCAGDACRDVVTDWTAACKWLTTASPKRRGWWTRWRVQRGGDSKRQRRSQHRAAR